MNIARDLCGGQICVTPDLAAFETHETKPWLDKFYTLNEDWVAEDRRKLLVFAPDLISSDHDGHRLAFQMFAQSPRFNQMTAVYRTFDWDGPFDFVKKSAGLSDRVRPAATRPTSDRAVTRYFAEKADAKRAAE